MKTLETQKLENKDDLVLLTEGDKVEINLPGYQGEITFLREELGTFNFIRLDGERVLEYYLRMRNLDVENGKIQTHNIQKVSPEIFDRNSQQYDIYKKIIDGGLN